MGNDELIAELKRQLQKREEEIQILHQLIDQSQKLLLNEQNKNQLLLSENIDDKKKLVAILEVKNINYKKHLI